MRTAAAVAFLSFAAAAVAYTVTSPTNATGWTTTGPNVVSWTKVNTDPSNFTIVLSNQAHFPPLQEVLLAFVDTGKGSSVTVNPPSGGWVADKGYRVNFVKSAEELNTILAQSDDFSITSGTGSSTFSSNTPSNTVTVPNTSSATNTPGSNQNSGSNTSGSAAPNSPSSTDTSLNPANTNAPSGALPAFNMQAGVVAALAFLGSFLA